MDPREIIDKCIEDLVRRIDIKKTTLWEKLIQLGLFTLDDGKYIKVRF